MTASCSLKRIYFQMFFITYNFLQSYIAQKCSINNQQLWIFKYIIHYFQKEKKEMKKEIEKKEEKCNTLEKQEKSSSRYTLLIHKQFLAEKFFYELDSFTYLAVWDNLSSHQNKKNFKSIFVALRKLTLKICNGFHFCSIRVHQLSY